MRFTRFSRLVAGKKFHRILLPPRIQPEQPHRTYRLNRLQIPFVHEPLNCRIGLPQAVMELFLQQAPPRNPLKRVRCLGIAYKITEHLLRDFRFCFQS